MLILVLIAGMLAFLPLPWWTFHNMMHVHDGITALQGLQDKAELQARLLALIPNADDMMPSTDYKGLDIYLVPGGLLWVATYVLVIVRGFKDRSYGIPVLAVMCNFSWELLLGVIHPEPEPMALINKIYAAVDLFIVWQTVRFGYKEFAHILTRTQFLLLLPFGFLSAFSLMIGVMYEFGDFEGKYTGWGINLWMSMLFVFMILRRGNADGQSVYIAIFKMAGTVLMNFAQMIRTPDSVLLPAMMSITLVLDLAYLALVYGAIKQNKENPWLRL